MGKTMRVLVRGGLWIYLAITVCFAAVTVGGVALFGGKNLFGTYLLSNSLLCVMFYLMSGVMLGSIWPGLCLSMGATRRQFFAGLQAAMLLGLAAYLAIMAAVGAAFQQLLAAGRMELAADFMLLRVDTPAALVQAVGLLAVFGQLGILLGLLSARIGRIGYVASMVLIILFCIALYLVVGFGQSGLFHMPLLLQPGPLGGICCALALAAAVGCGGLLRRFAVQ